MARRNYALENYRDCVAALRMIREAIETLGPPGILPSEEAVVMRYGPEPVHEAEAIVDALRELLGPVDGSVRDEGPRIPKSEDL